MKKILQKHLVQLILKVILFLLPFGIGFVGFLSVDDESPLWAAYHSIRLYSLNTDITDLNPLIEIARWLAPVAMCTTLIVLVRSIWTKIQYRLRSLSNKSVSVYGNNSDSEKLLSILGKKGIRGDLEKPLFNKYHILITHDDLAAAKFLDNYATVFPKKCQIYICLDEISPLSLQTKLVTAFSLEENSVSDYWSRFPAIKSEKIALIGCGKLADIMLYKALLVNIFFENQRIEYHLWNNRGEFLNSRFMSKTAAVFAGDQIIEHSKDFCRDIIELNHMDRVILCMSESENLEAASKIRELCCHPAIYIYSRNSNAVSALYEESVICYGESERVLQPEMIMHERIVENAKKINAHYCEMYGGTEWENLSVFLRKSNISAAEYFQIIRRLNESGVSIEQLTRLEHIRWCRFHFLNNWQYSEKRDNSKRLHPCLRPFDELSPEEQKKDEENVLLAINNCLNLEVLYD